MRYTEEKETKNRPRSHPVTVRIRWERSAYSSLLAICKTAVLSAGNSVWGGCFGPGVRFFSCSSSFNLLCQRTIRRLLIIIRQQIRVMERPRCFADLTSNRISIFCPSSNQQPFISPTNPHSFFFLVSPVRPKDLQGPAPSLPVPFSMRRNLPWKRSFVWHQDDPPAARGRLLSPSAGYGLNRLNISLHGVRCPPLDLWRSVFLRISDISSQGLETVSLLFLIDFHSRYPPFALSGEGVTPVALRAPSVTPSFR